MSTTKTYTVQSLPFRHYPCIKSGSIGEVSSRTHTLALSRSLLLILFPTVYTTTNKKLQDPTARRLENFWWHVLGSDRRHLSGHALAKIYEDISNGPTFVPLEGPSDRWEEPVVSDEFRLGDNSPSDQFRLLHRSNIIRPSNANEQSHR